LITIAASPGGLRIPSLAPFRQVPRDNNA